MPHDPGQVFLIAALAAVGLVILIPLIIYLVHKLFFFDWPPLYEWQQARRQLHRIDQGRVIWATYRHHPASRATLADAQLAHARYRQASAQRALDRRRPGRESPRQRSAASWRLAARPLPPQTVSSGSPSSGRRPRMPAARSAS